MTEIKSLLPSAKKSTTYKSKPVRKFYAIENKRDLYDGIALAFEELSRRQTEIIIMTRTQATTDTLTHTGAESSFIGPNVNEFHLRLVNNLQSSLDLHETLATFYQVLQRVMRCSGMEYRLPSRDIRLALGTHRAHKANYNLHNGGVPVGEITFFRSGRFSEKELSTLEGLLALLLQPLRNALLYRSALENALRDTVAEDITDTGNSTELEFTLQHELK